MTIVLYASAEWNSPYVFTVQTALMEKGLGFEVRELNLGAGEQRTADYRARSLTARVPAIDHDGFSLSESTAIVEYLEDVFPAPKWPRVLPEAPRDRARARQIMAWLRSDLLPLREERSTDTMFFERAKSPLGKAAREAAEKLFFVADRLVAEGATSLFGSWSIADADLGFFLHRLILNGDAVPDKLRRYAEAQWARPSVRRFVEHERPAHSAPK
jgi:glutathione S-transferase